MYGQATVEKRNAPISKPLTVSGSMGLVHLGGPQDVPWG